MVIIHPCYLYLYCLYTSESCWKTHSCGDGIERGFYDNLSWLVLNNVKVWKSGYAILESTSLAEIETQWWYNHPWLCHSLSKWSEAGSDSSKAWLYSQCWKFTQQNSLVSKVQQTTRNQEVVIEVCRTSRFAQALLFLFFMACISGGFRNTGL